jgi:hypothetical protein
MTLKVSLHLSGRLSECHNAFALPTRASESEPLPFMSIVEGADHRLVIPRSRYKPWQQPDATRRPCLSFLVLLVLGTTEPRKRSEDLLSTCPPSDRFDEASFSCSHPSLLVLVCTQLTFAGESSLGGLWAFPMAHYQCHAQAGYDCRFRCAHPAKSRDALQATRC